MRILRKHPKPVPRRSGPRILTVKGIRHYGLLSPARKKDALAAARAALDVPPPQAAVIESVAEFMQRVAHIEHARCPHCKIGQFRVVATLLPERNLRNPRGPP